MKITSFTILLCGVWFALSNNSLADSLSAPPPERTIITTAANPEARDIALRHNSDSAPQLSLQNASTGDPLAAAMLLNTAISGRVDGMLATMTVKQTFENPSDGWAHGVYVFPLPPNAAVDRLTFIVNGEKIRAEIHERKEAEKIFKAARQAGKKAALLSQERPNLFTMNVSNIPPHGKVDAEIRYVELAHYDNATFSLRIPTTLTPRYIPLSSTEALPQTQTTDAAPQTSSADITAPADKTIAVSNTHGWAVDTAAVPDASRITPYQTHAFASQNSHRYSFTLTLNSGIALKNIEASNALNITERGNEKIIMLQNKTAPMNHDLIVQWQTANSAPQAAVFTQQLDDAYYTLTMLVPPVAPVQDTRPRKVLFVIDTSGSMAGESIEQAKLAIGKALGQLNANDAFNIIEFNNSANKLFNTPVLATAQHIGQAKTFVAALEANGGTEILGALSLATGTSQTMHDRLEQIIFITDGSVGNEGEIFSAIKHRIGKNRLFTVGIGAAPNQHFMQKAAQYGRGSYTNINQTVDVAQKMNSLFTKIKAPVIQGLAVDWHGAEVESYPQQLPDLYLNEPLTLVSRSEKPVQTVSINGRYGQRDWQRTLSLEHHATSKNLNVLWGRRKIADITDSMHLNLISPEEARQHIVPIALQHQLLSKFTSFVAVKEEISRDTTEHPAHTVPVPNLMPHGSTMAAPYPNTATAAEMLQWLGLLCLLLSLIGIHLTRYRRITMLS